VFDDMGEILPGGQVISPLPAHARLPVGVGNARTGGGTSCTHVCDAVHRDERRRLADPRAGQKAPRACGQARQIRTMTRMTHRSKV